MENRWNTKTQTGCCDGNVVSIEGNWLTYTDEKGEEHQANVAHDAKINCNGEKGSLENLEEGLNIRMTMCQDNENKIVAIECDPQSPELSNY